MLEISYDRRKHYFRQVSSHAFPLTTERAKKGKIVAAKEAVRIIRDNDTIATGGFVGIGFAEEIAIKLEEYFLETGKPRGLTLIYAAGQGDGGEKGLNHFGHEELTRRVIEGHWGLAPKLQRQATENKILAYNLPQGAISYMYRDIGAGKPRTITTVGLGTFVDPRNGGGKINEMTTEDIVELITFDGEEYLACKTHPINVAILRGTTADTDGNITIEKEATKILSPIGKKVYAIVHYDNFTILPELVDEYTEMVKHIVNKFYIGVTRYTTSTFLRAKLGDALKKRDVAPYLFESSQEAKRALGKE